MAPEKKERLPRRAAVLFEGVPRILEMRFMREPPVAARRVFGVVSRRDSNWVRAAVFEHRFGQHLLQLRIFLLQLLEPFGIGQIHLPIAPKPVRIDLRRSDRPSSAPPLNILKLLHAALAAISPTPCDAFLRNHPPATDRSRCLLLVRWPSKPPRACQPTGIRHPPRCLLAALPHCRQSG